MFVLSQTNKFAGVFPSQRLLAQLGVAANFFTVSSNLAMVAKLGNLLFIKFAFEFGCDIVFMSHPITPSLSSKLW